MTLRLDGKIAAGGRFTAFRSGLRRLLASAALAMFAWGIGAASVSANCRQALVFALDVSGSVDEHEYRQQLDGLATALMDEQVLMSVLSDPKYPMAVAVFEWSAANYANLIVGWHLLTSHDDVAEFAGRLRAWQRIPAPSETGLGSGLKFAADLLRDAPKCFEQTIDVSIDGKNNDGPSPETVHATGILEGVTVNGLVVGAVPGTASHPEEDAEVLADYLKRTTVRGPGSFVTIAEGYGDYTAAMRRKLLKEIASVHRDFWREALETRG